MASRRKGPAIDPDIFLVWGIVAFLAFMGVAAVGFYVGSVSIVMEQTPKRSSTALNK